MLVRLDTSLFIEVDDDIGEDEASAQALGTFLSFQKEKVKLRVVNDSVFTMQLLTGHDTTLELQRGKKVIVMNVLGTSEKDVLRRPS